MRKHTVFNAMPILLLVVTLLFVSAVEAGTWSSPLNLAENIFINPQLGGGPSISGDGSKIAFASYDGSDTEIFVVNSDGSELTQLTDNSERDSHPSISGDGSKIAFEKHYDSDIENRSCEIFVVNSDGSELTQLTNNSNNYENVHPYNPYISGDGSKVAFHLWDGNNWNKEVFVVNSDGSELTQLTDNTYYDQYPSISDDGGKVAFLGGDDFDFQFFVVNSDGSELTQLTNNSNNYENMDPFGPSISGDGSKVAFEGYDGSDTEIFVVNSDGSELTQLTNNSKYDAYPSFSGDGSKIAFASYDGSDTEIFVVNSDGSELTQLTDNSKRDMYPSISDDGETIVFGSSFESDFCVSLVHYLSDAEDENGAGSTFPTEIVMGGIVSGFVFCIMAFIYLKRKERYKI